MRAQRQEDHRFGHQPSFKLSERMIEKDTLHLIWSPFMHVHAMYEHMHTHTHARMQIHIKQ